MAKMAPAPDDTPQSDGENDEASPGALDVPPPRTAPERPGATATPSANAVEDSEGVSHDDATPDTATPDTASTAPALPADQHTDSDAAALPVIAEPSQAAAATPSGGRGPILAAQRLWTLALVLLPAVFLGVLGYRRRWIADDGLIYTRPVRQILDGHGPVFNSYERAESATGTLWQWIVAAASWITGGNPSVVAVYLGLACAVIGVVVAVDATRRLQRELGHGGLLLPAGVLILVALPPEWDFATSGLETGFATLWMATCWWLLVHTPRARRLATRLTTLVVVGLGPMVRPDLALVTFFFAVALLIVWRPRPLRLIGQLVVLAAIPVLYEIFRMGFYGELVPLPALTKEAGASDWRRGFTYLRDFVDPYWLWIPALLLAVAAVTVWRRAHRERRDSRAVAAQQAPSGAAVTERRGPLRRGWAALRGRPHLAIIAAPLCCGAVMMAYVVRVGGDFMHARMLLPGLFMVLAPLLVLPLTRLVAPAVVGLAAWCGVCVVALRIPYEHKVSPTTQIADERGFWIGVTHEEHPETAAPFADHLLSLNSRIAESHSHYPRVLVLVVSTPDASSPFRYWYGPLAADVPGNLVAVEGNLGTLGATVPLDQTADDPDGLAYPLAAHVEITQRGRAGHEKLLPTAWIVADLTPPGTPVPSWVADPADVAAARHALTCGPMKDLQDSVQQPMSVDRFWENFTGSFRRTTFRFPADPRAAERLYCGSTIPAGAPAPTAAPTTPTAVSTDTRRPTVPPADGSAVLALGAGTVAVRRRRSADRADNALTQS